MRPRGRAIARLPGQARSPAVGPSQHRVFRLRRKGGKRRHIEELANRGDKVLGVFAHDEQRHAAGIVHVFVERPAHLACSKAWINGAESAQLPKARNCMNSRRSSVTGLPSAAAAFFANIDRFVRFRAHFILPRRCPVSYILPNWYHRGIDFSPSTREIEVAFRSRFYSRSRDCPATHADLRRPQRHAAALLLLVCTAWLVLTGTQIVRDVSDLAQFAGLVFQILAPLQLALAVFFSAMLAASAVAQEKDRRTFVLLLLTNLSNQELVLGNSWPACWTCW